jgi:hypothetical protein
VLETVTPDETLTVLIGSGGAGIPGNDVCPPAAGGTGGTTSVRLPSGQMLVAAPGGSGGVEPTTSSPLPCYTGPPGGAGGVPAASAIGSTLRAVPGTSGKPPTGQDDCPTTSQTGGAGGGVPGVAGSGGAGGTGSCSFAYTASAPGQGGYVEVLAL